MFRHLLLPALAALVGLCGCLESKFPIASDAPPKVDRALVGDWIVKPDAGKPPVTLTVRNWDDKEYYAEWAESDARQSDKILRLRAAIVDVKGAHFAHLRKLEEDGSIPDAYLIMKVSLKDGKLVLQNLSEDFFKQHPIESSKQFRATVEANVDNPAMYDKETITAEPANAATTQASEEKQP